MQRKVPAEKASAAAVQAAAAVGPEPADAEEEQGHAQRDHQREAEVDQVGLRPRRPGAEHQADDRQGVGRLVDDRGEEDAPGGRARAPCAGRAARSPATALARATPPTSECTARPNAAAPQCSDVPLASARAPPGASASTRPAEWPRPCGVLVRVRRAGLLRVGRRLVVVEGEEPLEEEQGQQPDRRPAERARRAQPDRLGHHVEERRPEHRPGREAQVELEPGVRQDRRQRQQAPEQAHPDDRHAEQREGGAPSCGRRLPDAPRADALVPPAPARK